MQLYNTLTKRKEAFVPLTAGQVKMYTCGPTVYDYVHIGNLRSYVMADTLRRVLEADGLLVTHVKNITDVGHLTVDNLGQGDSGEDKLIKKASKEGKTPEAIARFYTEYYHRTEAALQNKPATWEPQATGYVPQMIALIEQLIETGHAYVNRGNVFFDVTTFPAYGRLSGNTLKKLKVGARLEEHPDKRHPWDFALWLKAPLGHLMHWASPWSEGYPGWHIECSAMNLATLGPTIDIHTGGEDNIFPHHEAEIAQSECANAVPFVRYWMHVRHLLVDGEKMSKSKGNVYRLEDVEQRGYSSTDLRMLYLSSHYRSQMNFTWEALDQAKANIKTFQHIMDRLRQQLLEYPAGSTEKSASPDIEKQQQDFLEALHDDLNTQKALAILFQLTAALNSRLDTGKLSQPETYLAFLKTALTEMLGLTFEKETALPADIVQLLEARQAARAEKDFPLADALRTAILTHGYVVEDGQQGQTVRRK